MNESAMDTRHLVDALHDLTDAQAEEAAGRANYTGGSWGYHGSWLIEARAKAEARFEEVFNSVVDARVVAVLKARGL